MVQPIARPPRTYGASIWIIPLVGVLLGILAGVLFFFGFLPLAMPIFIAQALFAALEIALLVVLNALRGRCCHPYKFAPWTVISVLGLLTLAIYSLGAILLPGNVLAALLFGATSILFFMSVLSLGFTIVHLEGA